MLCSIAVTIAVSEALLYITSVAITIENKLAIGDAITVAV